MEFKTWIEVSFERMETLKALELPDVFTTEPGAGRIRAVDQSEICSSALHQWNKEQPTLAILPTSRPLISFHPYVHVVPYSDHSSYQELEDFVSALKPTCLIPIVGKCVPGSLSALLPHKKRHEILVPESVRHYMSREPESQLCSSAYTSLRRKHFHPLVPKGVVFESPVRGSGMSCEEAWEAECAELDGSGEETETESSEKDSNSILLDLSKELTPSRNGRGAGDVWNLNIVQTVREERAREGSTPLSEIAPSRFSPVEILANTDASVTTALSLETSAKIINNQHSGCENNHTLPIENAMSQHCGMDQNDSVTLFQNSPDNDSRASSSPLALNYEYIEELEDRLLKNLPFSEEDFKSCGLLQKGFVQQFTPSPLQYSKDLSD